MAYHHSVLTAPEMLGFQNAKHCVFLVSRTAPHRLADETATVERVNFDGGWTISCNWPAVGTDERNGIEDSTY
jgi:hypothetical protein